LVRKVCEQWIAEGMTDGAVVRYCLGNGEKLLYVCAATPDNEAEQVVLTVTDITSNQRNEK